MHFGTTLRLLRTEAGISLRALASRIGVSGAYLSRIENGHDPAPTPDRLIAIADALGLPRPVLVDLARQAGPAVDGYLQRTPEAGSLFLDIARRDLRGPQLARIKAFIDAEFPADQVTATRRLVDRLPVERIVTRVSCSDLEELVSVAASRLGDDVDARIIVQRAREPTPIGGGFAVLQVVLGPVIEQLEIVVMLTLAEALDLPTPDGRPVRVAFLLVRGVDSPSRLELLTRVVRLASYGIAEQLCAASTPEQARSILEQVESVW
jgi:PTS system nitrogen regulatory IIA component